MSKLKQPENPVCICGKIKPAQHNEWNLLSIPLVVIYPMSFVLSLVGVLSDAPSSYGLFIVFFLGFTTFLLYWAHAYRKQATVSAVHCVGVSSRPPSKANSGDTLLTANAAGTSDAKPGALVDTASNEWYYAGKYNIRTDMGTVDSPTRSFSAIHFAKLLEKEIAAINTYPLSSENFVVQQDAYKRLGSIDESDLTDEDMFDIFATLECSRKQRDTDMRFAIEISLMGYLLSIEGVGGMFIEFGEAFKNEKDAVKQTLTTLQMLANGQLACLITTRNGVGCCSEFLIYDQGSRKPKVLATDGDYKRWWRKNDESGYDTVVLRNRYIEEPISIPKNLFLIDRNSEGKQAVKGRTFTTNELTPLTKKMYLEVLSVVGDDLIGKQPGEEDEDVLVRHWEFWAISIAVGIALITASLKGWIPEFIAGTVFIPTLAGLFVSGLISTFVIMKKVQLRDRNPDHIWFKLDAWLAKNGLQSLGLLSLLAFTVTTFFPVYVPIGSSQATNFYEIADTQQWGYLALAFFALAAMGVIKRNILGASTYIAGVLAAIITLFALNETTDTNADTPEPYLTMIMLAYIIGPVVAIILGILLIKRYRKAKPTDEVMNASSKVVGAEEIHKYQRRLEIAKKIQIVCGFVGAVSLAISALSYALTLPDASVATGSRFHVVGILLLAAGLLVAGAIILKKQIVKYTVISTLAWVVFVGCMLAWAHMLKEGSDEGSVIAWVAMLTGVGSFFGASLVRDGLETNVRQEGIKQNVFADDSIKQERSS